MERGFWRTLLAGMADFPKVLALPEGIPLSMSVIEVFEIWMGKKAFHSSSALDDHDMTPKQNSFLESYIGAFKTTCAGSRISLLENGVMGLGPFHAMVNDVVCIFLDGMTPFLLWDGNDDDYKLVGPAFGRCCPSF
jgi:hypothetical protein